MATLFNKIRKVREGGRRVDGVKICNATRFLDWCNEREMNIIQSWSEHFTKKGIRHVVGRIDDRVSIWRDGMERG